MSAKEQLYIGLDMGGWVKRGRLAVHATRPSAYGLETHLVTLHKLVDDLLWKASSLGSPNPQDLGWPKSATQRAGCRGTELH